MSCLRSKLEAKQGIVSSGRQIHENGRRGSAGVDLGVAECSHPTWG